MNVNKEIKKAHKKAAQATNNKEEHPKLFAEAFAILSKASKTAKGEDLQQINRAFREIAECEHTMKAFLRVFG